MATKSAAAKSAAAKKPKAAAAADTAAADATATTASANTDTEAVAAPANSDGAAAVDDTGTIEGAEARGETGAADTTAESDLSEATERLADQGQRPVVVLPPGVGTYRVLSALNHDLQDYPEGSEITLTVDQAAPLLGHTVEHKNAPADDA